MASVEDYVGQSFGRFQIVQHMAQGAEAEVFACKDMMVGRGYVLRLDAHDDRLWEGRAPLIPPENYSLESKNALGTWKMTPSYRNRVRTDDHDVVFRTVPIYAIVDSRYFVPVASPFRVQGALNVDELLTIAPANDLLYFELWEDIALHMLSDAHHVESGKTTEADWSRRWAGLLGGDILTSAIKQYLLAGSLSTPEQTRIVKRVARANSRNPELAENLILRLCGAVSRGRISLEQAQATLSCRHFRINLTIHELKQMVLANETLQELSSPLTRDKESLELLTWALIRLGEEPVDEWQDSDAVAQVTDQPDLSRFSLFLQEYAGGDQPIPTLNVREA